MNGRCRDFEQRVLGLARRSEDRDDPRSRSARAHAAECPDCAALLREARGVDAALSAPAEVGSPPNLAGVRQAIHAELEASSAWRASAAWWVSGILLAAAAILAAVMGARPDLEQLPASALWATSLFGGGSLVVALAVLRRFGRFRRGLLWGGVLLALAAVATPIVTTATSWKWVGSAQFWTATARCGGLGVMLGLISSGIFLALAWRTRRADGFVSNATIAGALAIPVASGTLFLICPGSAGVHLLFGHGVALLAIAAMGWALAKVLARPALGGRC